MRAKIRKTDNIIITITVFDNPLGVDPGDWYGDGYGDGPGVFFDGLCGGIIIFLSGGLPVA